MGLSRTISELNGDFSRKSQNFATPLYFLLQLTGFPLDLSIGALSQETRRLPHGQKSFNIGLAVQRRNTVVWRRDGQTDAQTPYGGKDRAMQSDARENNAYRYLSRLADKCK